MSEFKPTRGCPHRWCRVTHLSSSAMIMIFIGYVLLGGIESIVYLIASMAVGYLAIRTVHGRSLTDVVAQDIAEQLSKTTHLIVRPVWARIAIGLDLTILAVATVAAASAITNPSSASINTPTSTVLPGLLVGGQLELR